MLRHFRGLSCTYGMLRPPRESTGGAGTTAHPDRVQGIAPRDGRRPIPGERPRDAPGGRPGQLHLISPDNRADLTLVCVCGHAGSTGILESDSEGFEEHTLSRIPEDPLSLRGRFTARCGLRLRSDSARIPPSEGGVRGAGVLAYGVRRVHSLAGLLTKAYALLCRADWHLVCSYLRVAIPEHPGALAAILCGCWMDSCWCIGWIPRAPRVLAP